MPITTWRETPAPDEDQRFERYAEQLAALQTRNRSPGGFGRALHHKGHGVFEASLEVLGDLPEDARHGLFAQPKTYEAVVRYSSGASKLQPDSVADVRGLAVKVLGVDGDKVLGTAMTQDLLAILSSSTPFRTADEFVAVVWGTRSPALALFRLLGALGPRAFSLVRKLVAGLKRPPASLDSTPFYSALPIQCGPSAVRFALTPVDVAAEALSNEPNFHAGALAARIRRAPVVYDVSLQFFVDEARTPIEDGSVDWDTPYVKVARLTIPKQDASSARGRLLVERGDKLSFDPWHALVAHKPLGGMMRARKHAYFASTKQRSASPEPTSLAAFLA